MTTAAAETATQTDAERVLTDQRFDALPLAPDIQRAVAEIGFECLTPIQALALTPALAGKDVAGQGQTGTGKTAAFLLAMLHRLQREPAADDRPANDPRAIIIAPTRELALQIHKDAVALNRHTKHQLCLAYGGVDYDKQRDAIRQQCDVLIGTPGRIIDFFKQKVFTLRHIQVAILDEADRMFDLGFIKDIRFLLRRMPKPEARQTLMFSATLSYRVEELAYEHTNDPEYVEAQSDKMSFKRVTQKVFMPAMSEKLPLLVGLIKALDPSRAIVFTNTRHACEDVTRTLQVNEISAGMLSGNVRQHKRQSLLKRFAKGDIDVLVATDVAARGLHIPEVSHVFNYDLPQDSEDFVHRVGRTGRLGAEGHAISLACEKFAFSLPDIESYIDASLPIEPVDPALMVDIKRPEPVARKARGAGPKNKRGGGRRRRRRAGPKQSANG